MHLPTQLAHHLKAVYFGGNWTSVNLKTELSGLSWAQVTAQVYGLNSIATLVHHVHYYVRVVGKVLQGGPLDAKDKYSFEYPPIQSQEDWDQRLEQIWAEAEAFADMIAQLPEQQLWEVFSDSKYGNYYRNLQGIIEHLHYHLGQIVLIKKILLQRGEG